MTKRAISVLVIALLVIAVLGVSTDARTSGTDNSRVETLNEYSFSPKKAINDETRNQYPGRSTPPPMSLGTHTADGGSPGYIIGRSFRDDQAHLNPGRFVDWRNSPNVHFIFAGQLLAGHDDAAIARFIEYTMFDPTTSPNGVFLTNVWLQASPLTGGGWYPNMDVEETNHAIPTGEEFDPTDPLRATSIFWDYAGAGAWGTYIAEPLPQALSIAPDEFLMYPRIEYQEYDGKTIVHVVVNEDSGDLACDMNAITYWRKELDSARAVGTWTTSLVTDFVWSNHFDISASRVDGMVGIAWLEWPGWCDGGGDMDGVLYVQESTDGGASWLSTVQITELSWDYQPWVDVCGVYDTDGNLHVVYNTSPSGTITPSRIQHWTNAVAGPDGGGTTSLIAIVDGFEHYCGRGGYNVFLTGKPVISQCDTLLYVTWTQYGRWQDGDTLDCTDPSLPNDFGLPNMNAEIYVSISSGLDGGLWDLQRNLTNSHTPGCLGTDEENCDHDAYGTMARYGMNTADHSPTYWGAVPQALTVRDDLAPGYPDDGWYLDYQYVNDLYPEPARYHNDAEATIWTYNPIKWFRLPCVQPIIEPRIHISQAAYTHPVYWVKNGESPVIDLEIHNLGNAELAITGIVEQTDETWLSVLAWPATIPPATDDTAQFQIDASGYAAGTTTALAATLVVSSNDVNAGDLYYEINTIAADTVILPTWDTVTTTVTAGYGLSLTVSSHGNAGDVGTEEVNMDFTNSGDCSEGATVYMYDLCPVIMHSTTQYSWQPFWQTTRTDTVNFQCVGNVATEHTTTDDYEMYQSGSFVTSDSLIECVKYWIAPTNDDNFMLERWDIYPADEGSSLTGIRIGEWIDWDVPTGGTGNEGGAVNSTGGTDYVYQRGTVDLEADPPPCLSEDRRFAASGLLGYFTTEEYGADDAVNHNDLFGGFIQLDADIFVTGQDNFVPDSAWAFLNRNEMAANNSEDDDQQAWLSFGSFDLTGGDPLHIWIVHASVYDGDEDSVQAVIDRATAWYNANRDTFHGTGCCGTYADLPTWPTGYTGNCNCSADGKRTLSDITKLIDNVYISKDPLCCYASGNTNGSWDDGDCKITLSDITKLIDAVYISKNLTEPCISGCER